MARGRCWWWLPISPAGREASIVNEVRSVVDWQRARCGTVKVQKLVRPSAEKRTPIEAGYQTITRNIKVSDAMVGRNPAGTSGDGKATGRTCCLSAVPAEYKPIAKRVIDKEAIVKKVAVPASYKTLRMHKLVSAATEKHIPVPASHKIVPKHKGIRCPSGMASGSVRDQYVT